MSGTRFKYILLTTLVVCFFTSLLTATAKFTYQHPQAVGKHFAVTRAGHIVQEAAGDDEPTARAEAAETEYNFGLMDPLTMGSHAFVVRNTGDAPLKLQAGPTSCKCTLSDVSDQAIPPGGESRVTVQWNTGRKNKFYAHDATIYTNDPTRRRLTFAVRGTVRVQLAVDPPAAVFERIKPDQPAHQKILVYSQTWDDVELADLQSSLAGLTWEIEPADNETLAKYEAQSAYWIQLTTPGALPEGTFSEWLQFRVVPAGAPDEAVEHQVAVSGKTLRRLAVYGPGIDAEGTVAFGAVSRAAGAKKRLLMKVRDPEAELAVNRIRTTPEFLSVRVVPGAEAATKGLHYLELEVPPGAPRSDFLSGSPATILIEFEHPRIRQLELTAQFAVVE